MAQLKPTVPEALAAHAKQYADFKPKRNVIFGLVPDKPEDQSYGAVRQRIIDAREGYFGALPPWPTERTPPYLVARMRAQREEAEAAQKQYIYVLSLLQIFNEHWGRGDKIDLVAREILSAGSAAMGHAAANLIAKPTSEASDPVLRKELVTHIYGELTNVYKFAAGLEGIACAHELGIRVDLIYTFAQVMVLNELGIILRREARERRYLAFVGEWHEEMEWMAAPAGRAERDGFNAGKAADDSSKVDGYAFSDDHMDWVCTDLHDFYMWLQSNDCARTCGFALPYDSPVSARLVDALANLKARVGI